MSEPRAYTKEEVQGFLLSHLSSLVDYWDTAKEAGSQKERLGGLAFSILAVIDGASICLPAIDLVLRPHPDGKKYHQDQDEDWFEDGMVINKDVSLHDMILKEK